MFVDDNGELQCEYSRNKESYVHIKKVIFLNVVGYEKLKRLNEKGKPMKDEYGNTIFTKGKLLSFEPLDCVNEFILAKHVEKEVKEAQQTSAN